MKILGIEFSSSNLNYVLIETPDEGYEIKLFNKLTLGDTRNRDALVDFQNAVKTLFNSAQPELIGIKKKPEKGNLRAGAAALKMEAITIANSPCQIEFISGTQVKKCEKSNESLSAYLQPALKAALAASAKIRG